MPRSGRFMPVDAALHVMCRGNNRQIIFHHDSDKMYYWRLINELKDENRVVIFNYCIMNNHVHLIVWVASASRLSRFMKQLNLSYFSYYKKTYGYCGHIMQGRYKSNIIETSTYLLHCGKYVELNPVRAGIVGLPEEYAFSSYRYYAYGRPDAVISDNPCFFGLAGHINERRERYVEFAVDSSIINSDKLVEQDFIGSQDFISKLRQDFGIKDIISKGGRPRKSKTIEASPSFLEEEER